jgi:3-deoxy-D-manno-octulosonic-acid transferase
VVEGEDDLYLDAIAQALRHPSRPFVVYVPRKPERFDEVAGMLTKRGLPVLRRSQALDATLTAQSFPSPSRRGDGGRGHPAGPPDILLGDSLGEMYFYLALADRVVTGGGFTPHGAHNIIEPLALKRPVIVGPEIHTIEYPATEAISAGVCLRAKTAHALTSALTDWLGPDPETIRAFFENHSGATAKTLAALDADLERR